MATNKKIKSFSPYRYNIQYATPGAGIIQNKKQYVKSSPVNQEEYVVTKKKSNFFTFLSTVFNYTLTDDCEIKFLNANSTFLIRTNKNIGESTIISETTSKLITKEYYITNRNSHEYSFISPNTIQLNHNFFTKKIDCIAILNDKKYLNFKIKTISQNIFQIVFLENLNLSDEDFIKIILYPLEGNFNIIDNIVSIKTYEYKDLIFDNLKNIIAIDNKNGTSRIIPLVYDIFDTTYSLESYDLNPSYISFKMNNFTSRYDLKNSINYIKDEMKKIRNENQNLSEDELLKVNSNYKDFQKELDDESFLLSQLNGLNYDYNIGKVVLYKINKESFLTNLSYGINKNSIQWFKENEDICVNINHNLNGDIKIILDGENFIDYSIFKIDNNNVKINFGSIKPKTCVLNIFKVL